LSSTIRCHSDTGAHDGRTEQHHAGVVDERVEATELGHRPFDGVCRLPLVGDVGLEDEHGAPVVADDGGQRLQTVLAPRRQGHGRTLSGQGDGRGRPDTARGPRHEGHRPVQSVCHGLILSTSGVVD
jgi:hypothetical protein